MEALLFAFVAAALAGLGDQTQTLAASLSARGGRPVPVLAGLAIAAAAMATVAYLAGSVVHDTIGVRPQTLLIALALAFAGVTGLMKQPSSPRAARFRGGPFLAALIFGGLAASSGRIQFMTLAFASRAEIPALAAIGGALGLVAAATPAALLGDRFLKLNLRGPRIAIACAFIVAAVLVYLNAPPRPV